MEQDWSVHALVYFYSAGSYLPWAVLHWRLDLEFTDMKTNIEMAREAGGYFAELPKGDAWLFDKEEQLEAFAELARVEEREACAKVCDAEEKTANEETWYQCAKELAKQIRARKQV
jgi:hypothetical protein